MSNKEMGPKTLSGKIIDASDGHVTFSLDGASCRLIRNMSFDEWSTWIHTHRDWILHAQPVVSESDVMPDDA